MQVGIPDSRGIQEKRSKDQEVRKDFTEEATVNTFVEVCQGIWERLGQTVVILMLTKFTKCSNTEAA